MRLELASEWMIKRRAGELQGPYRNEEDVRRDFSGPEGRGAVPAACVAVQELPAG